MNPGDKVHDAAMRISILILSLNASLVNVASAVTAADYARAERFLFWNKNSYVRNGDIQHHWIEGEDRFWYVRTSTVGNQEFVVVDAASGKRTSAFDQRTIAAALSQHTGKTVEAGKLPFSSFRYAQGRKAIEFQLAENLWTCRLDTGTCVNARPRGMANETLSPDGRWAAFLKGHDVWIRPTTGGAPFPLTTNGVENYGYAGSPGYSTHAVSDIRRPKPTPPQVIWSPDSRYLLTHRLDERQVKDSFLLQSTPEDGSMRPKLYTYRFAMPGDEHLPLSEPVVFDVPARRQRKLAIPPLICFNRTFIEKREAWWSADSASIHFLNWDRFSTSISLHKADPVSGAVREVLRETQRTGVPSELRRPAYLVALPIRTLSNGDVIWYSERDGWTHLYYYDGATGALRHQITRGAWLVRSIVRIDEARKQIYFMASGREPGRDPYEWYLYRIQFDGSELRLLTPEEAEHASSPPRGRLDPMLTETAIERFSPSGRYFVDSYSRPDRPAVLVLRAANGRLIERLEEADISKLRGGGYTPIEPFRTLAADGRTVIYGNLYRPSTFDPAKTYPIIDASYPGPQFIRTQKSFGKALFFELEAQSLAELGFIVVTVDGRGTPNRSRAFLDHSYGRLSKASDLEDHIAAIRQLAERYPYLDLARVGIDGVSGGGFAAAHALLALPDFYKVAVSAEGNHDQRSGYAFWGETWIGPLQGSDYLEGSNLPLAGKLKGKLLLMHGELDDNVSPASTLKLVDALIRANKDFDLLMIPNGNHSAAIKSPYFIRRKWDYFVRNLQHGEPPESYHIRGATND